MKFLKLSIYTGTFVMAIIYLILAFEFLPTPEQARLQKLEFECKDYYTARKLALEDFSKGIYHITFNGWKNSSNKSMLRDSILRAEYKIVPIYTGCVGTTNEVDHYIYTVIRQLAKQYGEDFYDRTVQRSISIAEQSENSINDF